MNYSKSKEPNRLGYTLENDIKFIGHEEIAKAQKLTKERIDYSPVMNFTKREIQQQSDDLHEKLGLNKKTPEKKKRKKKEGDYDNPKFYKQSFNVILKTYMKDTCKEQGIKMP